MQALLAALGSGGLLFVLIAGAETLYREALPNQISLGNLFRPRGLRTKRFFLGVILGITLAGIFIAYQTAFYIVAYRFGAWSPADVPYDNLLNTRFPWLFVLFFGFFPAVSEESLFRMFAIPFLRKLVRYLPVAVVLAAFIWGFGHAGYPQQPFYIRGVEVGIGGVALGLVMLRWGILPTLVWHYSVDAVYTALLLVRSHNLYFRLSGAASAGIVVLPLLVALVAYWWRGGFEPESGLLNADESAAAEEPAEAEPARRPRPCHHGVPAAHQPRAPGRHRDLRGRPAQPADSGEPFRRIAEIQDPGRAGARGGGRVSQAAGPGRRRLSSLDLPGHALERRRQSGGQVLSGAAAGERRLRSFSSGIGRCSTG